MEKMAVFVDDADHARQLLGPLLAPAAGEVQWVVVACAPRLTQRIGRWVPRRPREQWREQWAQALRARLEPLFAGARCEWTLARGPLDALAGRLRARLGADLRLLDARRPRLGIVAPPLAAGAPARAGWAAPVAVSSGLALVLALAD